MTNSMEETRKPKGQKTGIGKIAMFYVKTGKENNKNKKIPQKLCEENEKENQEGGRKADCSRRQTVGNMDEEIYDRMKGVTPYGRALKR